jgi:type IV pilus assembly protein PilW
MNKRLPTSSNIHFPQQGGWTLIELMVGVLVTAIVVAAGYAVLASSAKSVTANQQTVETQQNVRMAMDLLSQDIRQAGFGMIGQVGNCAIGGIPSAIVPADNNPAGPDRGPDRISLVVPVGNPVGTAADPAWILDADTSSGFSSIALPSAEVVTNMQTAVGNNLANQTISIGGAVTATVTTAAGSSLTLAPVPAPVSMRRNSPVYVLQCVTYQIIAPPDPTNLCEGRAPCLVRGVAGSAVAGLLDCTTAGSTCRVVADEIEDLQFAYACDGCVAAINNGTPDNIIDNQGGTAGFDEADFITDSPWSVSPMTADKIRLVQVTVVGRQRTADQGFGESNRIADQSTVLQVSDHLHSDGVFTSGDFATLTPPYTSTRRRLLTRTIEMRNLRI